MWACAHRVLSPRSSRELGTRALSPTPRDQARTQPHSFFGTPVLRAVHVRDGLRVFDSSD